MKLDLSKTGQYLITISNKQHKVVKFIDPNHQILSQKIFAFQTSKPELIFLIMNQLQNIKNYLERLHQIHSQFTLSTYLDITQQQQKNIMHIKVNTKFCQNPTLYDFYRTQLLNFGIKIKYDTKTMIYFFEEIFQLIVKGAGIDNYFYTPNNVFIVPPNPQSGFEVGRLLLNITSMAGLKFIFKDYSTFKESSEPKDYVIPKDEFIQIFPCLPPNTYTLIKSNQYDQLNVAIKIRSFAFLTLTFIIKRVPVFFEDMFDTMINPGAENIRFLVQNSPDRFKALIKLSKTQIEKVEKDTKIQLKLLFQKVFVKCDITWNEVYQIVFQRNTFNINSYLSSSSRTKDDQASKPYIQNQLYFQKMLKYIWELEPPSSKQFYRKRGFIDKGLAVYLLVKLNGNFHRQLRHLHLVEFFTQERFSQDANQIAIKLMRIFLSKNKTDGFTNSGQEVESSGDELSKEMIKNQPQPKNTIKPTQSDKKQFNPLAIRIEKQSSPSKRLPGCYPKGPTHFLQNIYTYQGGQQQASNTQKITTISHKLQVIANFENKLWLL